MNYVSSSIMNNQQQLVNQPGGNSTTQKSPVTNATGNFNGDDFSARGAKRSNSNRNLNQIINPTMNQPVNVNIEQRNDEEREKERASKRTRLRVSRACDRCRTQKIKCSGTKPCDTCSKQNRNCVYNNISSNISSGNGSNNGVPVPLTSFPTPTDVKNHDVSENATSQDYIQYLENKVKYLETIVTDPKLKIDLKPTYKYENPMIDETILANNAPSEEDDCFAFSLSKWRLQRRHHNILLTTLSKTIYNSLSTESRKQVIIPRTQYFGWNMSGSHYLKNSELPEFKELINDVNLSSRLLNYFFININPLFSIIFEPIMRKQLIHYEKHYKSSINNNDENDNSNTNQTRLFSAQLYLIYALSMRFLESTNEKFPKNLEEELFKGAYDVVKILSFEWESTEIIQCWILISLYLRITHRQTSSYASLGQAVNMTKSMALNYRIPENHTCKPFERLKVKRVFWCVYTFDKLFGLQSGKFFSLKNEEITLDFPSMNYEVENDGWLSLPALGMIHLAIISSEIQTFKSESLPLWKVHKINKSLLIWDAWMDECGLDSDYFKLPSVLNISPLVKSQMKLNYYDLVINLNIRILFKYVGKKIKCEGLEIEPLVESAEGIIRIMQAYDENNLLLTPWYLTLNLLFNVGLISVTFINAGLYTSNCNYLLSQTINLISKIRTPFTNLNGEVQYRDNVTMAKECLWALKMLNHMCSLRLQESVRSFQAIGIDHGPSDVNRNRFLQFGRKEKIPNISDTKTDIYNNLIRDDATTSATKIDANAIRNIPGIKSGVQTPLQQSANLNAAGPIDKSGVNVNDSNNKNNGNENPVRLDADLDSNLFNEFSKLFSEEFTPEEDNLFGNLQWFDQWVDFK